jgi:sterol desaturase/sphingolipid hydroxylase (fatty acid hydroxylase superfamily)
MRLSTWGYRADFFVYPLLIGTAALQGLGRARLPDGLAWAASAALGAFAWTMVEYAMHRWAFHGLPVLREWHAEHHRHPLARVGTPTWVSAPLFLAIWLALAASGRIVAAAGFAAGLMTGYLVYGVIHHGVHHWRVPAGSWLRRTQRRHASHHRGDFDGEFGVTTAWWDVVFGTRRPVVGARRRLPASGG